MTLSASTDIENTDNINGVTGISASIGYLASAGNLPTITGPGVTPFEFPGLGADADVDLST